MPVEALQFFKCLADETRLKALLLITREGELCVCELTQALDEIQPKVSRHLAQLKQCCLIQDRRQGQWVFYSLSPDLPSWCRETLQQTLEQNPGVISSPEAALLEPTSTTVWIASVLSHENPVLMYP